MAQAKAGRQALESTAQDQGRPRVVSLNLRSKLVAPSAGKAPVKDRGQSPPNPTPSAHREGSPPTQGHTVSQQQSQAQSAGP